ncbi:unnamed protein product [Oppiella nova]|uniref:poly(A)-specific ribonuclease n=1 Tax=Oppiella nova TaxID=334625 RepID=A0A7R9LJZ4_9ACAR|nr:unnamed protein product [Oppiella nova]CAG2164331.1 unnamed protein product [Oppiella nova]
MNGYYRQDSPYRHESPYTRTSPYRVTPYNGHPRAHIRDVWNHNLIDEFKTINRLVADYPYVSLDTEFPGVLQTRPTGPNGGVYYDQKEFDYQTVRCNVDELQVIQVGLTLMDGYGRTPYDRVGVSTWQFNFRFNLNVDKHSADSIHLLMSSELNFQRLATEGIVSQDFAEQLMASGLVLNDKCEWISFHGAYDFGYLIKILTDAPLPPMLRAFHELLRIYFPVIFDVKLILNAFNGHTGGLQEEAQNLGLRRFGRPHQAGSDSLLTGQLFFRVLDAYPYQSQDIDRFVGNIFKFSDAGSDSLLTGQLFFRVLDAYPYQSQDIDRFVGNIFKFSDVFIYN